jgi:hypothetical protein
VLLAEQIIHESSHVQLGLAIEHDDNLFETIRTMPACYSPFTQSIRTAERVLHGVVSYGRALEFWRKVSEHSGSFTQWFKIDNTVECADVARQRIAEIEGRVYRGWRALISCASANEIEVISGVYETVAQSKPDFLLSAAEKQELSKALPPIPLAELLLAIAGVKASRINVGVVASDTHRAILESGIAHCYSNGAFLPGTDENLGLFFNRFVSSCGLLDATSKHEALCYVAGSPELARKAWELDGDDAAGELFGIPACCRSFYWTQWPKVRRSGGDLFGALLVEHCSDKNVVISWQCNAAAMYLGGGVCWHFPCSLHCSNTKAIIEDRLKYLVKLDARLARGLEILQRRSFLWSQARGYGFLPPSADANTRLTAVEWIGGSPDFEDQTCIRDAVGRGWTLVVSD